MPDYNLTIDGIPKTISSDKVLSHDDLLKYVEQYRAMPEHKQAMEKQKPKGILEGIGQEFQRRREDIAGQMERRKQGVPETPEEKAKAEESMKSSIMSVAGGAGAGSTEMATGAAKLLKRGAEKLYQSGAKFLPSLTTTERAERVATGLEKGIIPNKSGVEQVGQEIDKLISERKSVLIPAAQTGATIPRTEVLKRLYDMLPKVAETDDPIGNLELIAKAEQKFMAHPREIPVDVAEKIKESIYKDLKESAYGEYKGIGKESKKALARGIKEVLNQRFPELQGINENMKEYINFKKSLDRAFNRIENRDLAPLAASVMASENKWMALGKALLDSASVKTRTAVVLNALVKKAGQRTTQGITQTVIQTPRLLAPGITYQREQE